MKNRFENFCDFFIFLFEQMPKSAYNVFVSEVRPKLKAANPHLAFGDVSKKIGALWKELSEEDKKPYYDKADISKEEEIHKHKHKKLHKGKKSKRISDSEDDDEF